MVLSLVGVLIPLLMTDPNKMIRTDGTKVTTPRHPSWKTEFYFLWIALRTDPLILMLFPLFFASNWFVFPFLHWLRVFFLLDELQVLYLAGKLTFKPNR